MSGEPKQMHFPSDGFNDAETVPAPNVEIQWKGTNLCCDFECECGNEFHIDGDFIYGIRCSCGASYELPRTIALKRVSAPVEMTHFCKGC